MGLDIYLKDPTSTYETESLWEGNLTHNLTDMAEAVGIYEAVWRPYRLLKHYDKIFCNDPENESDFEMFNVVIGELIIPIIEKGLKKLKENPEYYKKYDSPNDWGTYKDFVKFLEEYLTALKKYPKSIVITDR